MDRLKSLMREEELRFDAANPSDAELEEMEHALQQKLKSLAGARSEVLTQPVPEQIDRGETHKVVPLRKKPLKWGNWALALAAAALALFVVVPALQNPESDPNDSLMVSKGNSSSLSARCEISILQTADGSGTILPSADGMGYEGPAGTAFQVTVRCDRPGFLNVWIEGSGKFSFRNLPVTAGETRGILHDGKLASFVLQSQSPWVISGLLSDREITSEAALPGSETEAKNILGSASLLWFDRIAVKGTNS